MQRFSQKPKHTERGFTLIEILVYLAILVTVSGGALTMLFSLTDNINSGRSERLVTNSATIALERMLSDIRGADLVDTFYSTFDTNPGALTLIDGASTTAYSVVDGAIVIAKDGVTVGQLTNEQVTVDALRFYHYDNLQTEMVRILMTLTGVVGDATTTRTFEAASVLRGSYE